MSSNPFSNPFAKPSGESKDDTKPTAGKLDADDIENFLSADDDKVDDKDDKPEGKKEDEKTDKKSPKEDDEDEDSDLSDTEDEDDEAEEDEDKLELKEEEDEDEEKLDLKDKEEADLEVPPRKRDIQVKYPNIFKEFPFLDKMMFRDKAYTEMFGSFDEAKEVYNKVDRLNEFETQLFAGDTTEVLTAVKTANPKAFDKIVDTYLKSLAKVDKEAYDDVVGNFAKQIILGMATEAKRKGNKELDEASKILHEYCFDTDQWTDVKVRVKEDKSEEKTEIEKERAELMQDRFNTARNGLSTKVDNVLKATIAEHIDPRSQMSAYEKKNAVNEALTRLHGKIAGDKPFKNNLDKLWKHAFSDKFSESSLGGIKKSYLGKSKQLLSSVIKEVRTEVLKDNRSKGKEAKDDDDKEDKDTPRTRKSVNAGRPHQQSDKKANERQKGESVEEFFSR